MFDIDSARTLLKAANVFFEDDDGDEPKLAQTLNMNDVWCWASADGCYVPDEQLIEVAELFWMYGWAGILYWVSKTNDDMRSEFLDNNRFIDFVSNEEKIRKDFPDERAWKRFEYVIGG